MEAVPTGCGSKSAKTSRRASPRSSSTRCRTSAKGTGGPVSRHARNSSATSSPNIPGDEAMICPNFMNVPPRSWKLLRSGRASWAAGSGPWRMCRAGGARSERSARPPPWRWCAPVHQLAPRRLGQAPRVDPGDVLGERLHRLDRLRPMKQRPGGRCRRGAGRVRRCVVSLLVRVGEPRPPVERTGVSVTPRRRREADAGRKVCPDCPCKVEKRPKPGSSGEGSSAVPPNSPYLRDRFTDVVDSKVSRQGRGRDAIVDPSSNGRCPDGRLVAVTESLERPIEEAPEEASGLSGIGAPGSLCVGSPLMSVVPHCRRRPG